eukprot:TRINITY_DN19003_c0_g1_i2.p2 TRINITY_DN19003_c0_g1~~TRINITY_DN19003_c0_g1_i2.p2  ORF type:complete len:146 (+),score=0.58 TRINITY_DN19003_c0_g1_i2:33-470(+)
MFDRCLFFFFQAEDGIRDHAQSRGLGDVYKRQEYISACIQSFKYKFKLIIRRVSFRQFYYFAIFPVTCIHPLNFLFVCADIRIGDEFQSHQIGMNTSGYFSREPCVFRNISEFPTRMLWNFLLGVQCEMTDKEQTIKNELPDSQA